MHILPVRIYNVWGTLVDLILHYFDFWMKTDFQTNHVYIVNSSGGSRIWPYRDRDSVNGEGVECHWIIVDGLSKSYIFRAYLGQFLIKIWSKKIVREILYIERIFVEF